ncbi:helix-turn-helix domain-containing protein [Nocardiopsis aegyptia]|uniref:Nitroimidazol reductase NimA-like FMN-containing flavoprotein (Pyridoxamine 5'-phosphate oxidase superfamily) n=1 Tax=Nocardiopsis aegyptia TaxID=220378 RepID=A0A7Z0ER44_9ACTN|nr:pyridoxamine 5'-phosphate oxidase family protein [Nocardiopsis aegyptia]NYJ36761.1 nitroimidazol reductase NimA-like FMN-containing flavoprotein (pyridoxamine 5'-phosphate oxidase superfamily) [Nocardiopsis aegyptia]
MVDAHGNGHSTGDLGRRAALRRVEIGLSREEVAERAGMAPGYVAYVEEYTPLLTHSAMYRLAQALRTTPDQLLGAADEATPEQAAPPGTRTLVVALTRHECMALIEHGGVGRVAFVDPEGRVPLVQPVHYALIGSDVCFRASAVGALARALTHDGGAHDVGFQADRLVGTPWKGWTVLVTGPATLIRDSREAHAAHAAAPVCPWSAGEREICVRIVPAEVSGHRVSALRPSVWDASPEPRAGLRLAAAGGEAGHG